MQHSGKGFDIGSISVLDVDRIRFRHVWFMPPGHAGRSGRAAARSTSTRDPTIHQDVDICNRVQAGHATGIAPTGRMFTEPEFLLQHFQQRIVEMVSA